MGRARSWMIERAAQRVYSVAGTMDSAGDALPSATTKAQKEAKVTVRSSDGIFGIYPATVLSGTTPIFSGDKGVARLGNDGRIVYLHTPDWKESSDHLANFPFKDFLLGVTPAVTYKKNDRTSAKDIWITPQGQTAESFSSIKDTKLADTLAQYSSTSEKRFNYTEYIVFYKNDSFTGAWVELAWVEASGVVWLHRTFTCANMRSVLLYIGTLRWPGNDARPGVELFLRMRTITPNGKAQIGACKWLIKLYVERDQALAQITVVEETVGGSVTKATDPWQFRYPGGFYRVTMLRPAWLEDALEGDVTNLSHPFSTHKRAGVAIFSNTVREWMQDHSITSPSVDFPSAAAASDHIRKKAKAGEWMDAIVTYITLTSPKNAKVARVFVRCIDVRAFGAMGPVVAVPPQPHKLLTDALKVEPHLLCAVAPSVEAVSDMLATRRAMERLVRSTHAATALPTASARVCAVVAPILVDRTAILDWDAFIDEDYEPKKDVAEDRHAELFVPFVDPVTCKDADDSDSIEIPNDTLDAVCFESKQTDLFWVVSSVTPFYLSDTLDAWPEWKDTGVAIAAGVGAKGIGVLSPNINVHVEAALGKLDGRGVLERFRTTEARSKLSYSTAKTSVEGFKGGVVRISAIDGDNSIYTVQLAPTYVDRLFPLPKTGSYMAKVGEIEKGLAVWPGTSMPGLVARCVSWLLSVSPYSPVRPDTSLRVLLDLLCDGRCVYAALVHPEAESRDRRREIVEAVGRNEGALGAAWVAAVRAWAEAPRSLRLLALSLSAATSAYDAARVKWSLAARDGSAVDPCDFHVPDAPPTGGETPGAYSARLKVAYRDLAALLRTRKEESHAIPPLVSFARAFENGATCSSLFSDAVAETLPPLEAKNEDAKFANELAEMKDRGKLLDAPPFKAGVINESRLWFSTNSFFGKRTAGVENHPLLEVHKADYESPPDTLMVWTEQVIKDEVVISDAVTTHAIVVPVVRVAWRLPGRTVMHALAWLMTAVVESNVARYYGKQERPLLSAAYLEWRKGAIDASGLTSPRVLVAIDPSEHRISAGSPAAAFLDYLAQKLRAFFDYRTNDPRDLLSTADPLRAYMDRLDSEDAGAWPPLVFVHVFALAMRVTVRVFVLTSHGLGWDCWAAHEPSGVTPVLFGVKDDDAAPAVALTLAGRDARPCYVDPLLTHPAYVRPPFTVEEAIDDSGERHSLDVHARFARFWYTQNTHSLEYPALGFRDSPHTALHPGGAAREDDADETVLAVIEPSHV
jgi:hypothetical protein